MKQQYQNRDSSRDMSHRCGALGDPHSTNLKKGTRLPGIGEGCRGEEFAILSQLLCVATEDNHEMPQSGQAVPLSNLDPGISPVQIRNVISSANSLAGAAVKRTVLGGWGC